MTKKKCTGTCGDCNSTDCAATCRGVDTEKTGINYSFYSRVLNQPFDTLSELMAAEDKYFAEQKAKEDKATQKRDDAAKVGEAFKALNAARRVYKEDLTQLTEEYAESLEHLKKSFEHGKKDITGTLAAAEEAYKKALNEFTSKYPEGYHLTLKDGDFETTISGSAKVDKVTDKPSDFYSDIFRMIFGL